MSEVVMEEEVEEKIEQWERVIEIIRLVQLDQQNLETMVAALDQELKKEYEGVASNAIANNIITAYNLYRAAQYEWRYKETNESRG
jgi:hypothetical protein